MEILLNRGTIDQMFPGEMTNNAEPKFLEKSI